MTREQEEKNRQIGLEKAKAIVDINSFMFSDKKDLIEIEKLKRDIDLSLKDKQPIIISVGGEIPNYHHGKEVLDMFYEPDDTHYSFLTKEEYENKNNIIKTKE